MRYASPPKIPPARVLAAPEKRWSTFALTPDIARQTRPFSVTEPSAAAKNARATYSFQELADESKNWPINCL